MSAIKQAFGPFGSCGICGNTTHFEEPVCERCQGISSKKQYFRPSRVASVRQGYKHQGVKRGATV